MFTSDEEGQIADVAVPRRSRRQLPVRARPRAATRLVSNDDTDSDAASDDAEITQQARPRQMQVESDVSDDDAVDVQEMADSGFIVEDDASEAEGPASAADADGISVNVAPDGSSAAPMTAPVLRSTGVVVIKAADSNSKRNRACGFQRHNNGGQEGDWLPALDQNGKQIKSGPRCGTPGCGYHNHCKHCSAPGTDTSDISHHHERCPVWLASQQPSSTTARNSPFIPQTAEHQFLITISTGGEHCPEAYFENISKALRNIVEGGTHVITRVLIVQEVGKTHVYRHVHFYIRAMIPSEGPKGQYKKVKDWLHLVMGPRRVGERRIVQVKPCTADGAKDEVGVIKYLSKDVKKHTFKYWSNFVTLEDLQAWEAQIAAENPSWRSGKTWAVHATFDKHRSFRELEEVPNAKVGNYFLWAIQTKCCHLDPKILQTSRPGLFELDMLAAHERVVDSPAQATERDVAILLVGPEKANAIMRANAENDDYCYHDALFGPAVRGLSITQARDESQQAVLNGTPWELVRGPARVPQLPFNALMGWQRSFSKGLRHPSQQRARHLYWIAPGFHCGKSFMFTWMSMHMRAVVLTNPTSTDNAMMAISTWMEANDGPPHIVCVDITNSASQSGDINYSLLEQLCDARHVCFKYRSFSSMIPRAHVIVGCNAFPRRGKLPEDRLMHGGRSTVIDTAAIQDEFQLALSEMAAPVLHAEATAMHAHLLPAEVQCAPEKRARAADTTVFITAEDGMFTDDEGCAGTPPPE